ncbi:hypothetical protein ABT237_21770 [Streptomyces sp. NPDC001581]|uniref:hypothetical protein n=1 Tax=Streptomyces sp. NPDC001581 TaxID=3154386 RepID=UPI003326DC0D
MLRFGVPDEQFAIEDQAVWQLRLGGRRHVRPPVLDQRPATGPHQHRAAVRSTAPAVSVTRRWRACRQQGLDGNGSGLLVHGRWGPHAFRSAAHPLG